MLFNSSTQGKREDSTPTMPSTTGGPSTTAGVPSSSAGPSTIGGPSSSGQTAQMQGSAEEKKDSEAEGLAQLIPDIQETAKLLQKVVQEYREQKASHSRMVEGAGKGPGEEVTSLSAEEKYLARMKPLQFGKYYNLLPPLTLT